MTDAEKFPETWCRMWSEDAALAHDLLAEKGRQWSGRVTGLDDVVGPAATEAFISAYQRDVGNTFRARTRVVGDTMIAYTWDVTMRDGAVKTGLDFNVLVDGLVVDN